MRANEQVFKQKNFNSIVHLQKDCITLYPKAQYTKCEFWWNFGDGYLYP